MATRHKPLPMPWHRSSIAGRPPTPAGYYESGIRGLTDQAHHMIFPAEISDRLTSRESLPTHYNETDRDGCHLKPDYRRDIRCLAGIYRNCRRDTASPAMHARNPTTVRSASCNRLTSRSRGSRPTERRLAAMRATGHALQRGAVRHQDSGIVASNLSSFLALLRVNVPIWETGSRGTRIFCAFGVPYPYHAAAFATGNDGPHPYRGRFVLPSVKAVPA